MEEYENEERQQQETKRKYGKCIDVSFCVGAIGRSRLLFGGFYTLEETVTRHVKEDHTFWSTPIEQEDVVVVTVVKVVTQGHNWCLIML